MTNPLNIDTSSITDLLKDTKFASPIIETYRLEVGNFTNIESNINTDTAKLKLVGNGTAAVIGSGGCYKVYSVTAYLQKDKVDKQDTVNRMVKVKVVNSLKGLSIANSHEIYLKRSFFEKRSGKNIKTLTQTIKPLGFSAESDSGGYSSAFPSGANPVTFNNYPDTDYYYVVGGQLDKSNTNSYGVRTENRIVLEIVVAVYPADICSTSVIGKFNCGTGDVNKPNIRTALVNFFNKKV